MATPTFLLITYVNYGTDDHISRLLAAHAESLGSGNACVLVADTGLTYAATSPIAAMLAERGALLVERISGNPGYYPGASRALASYLARNPMPEWLVVANSDVDFSLDALLAHLRAFDRRPSSAPSPDVMAPSILTLPPVVDQNPLFPRRPTLPYLLGMAILSSSPSLWRSWCALRARRQHWRASVLAKLPSRAASPKEIYAPHGAFVVFSRNYFSAGASLETGVPFFAEEFTVGREAAARGLLVSYDPRVVVTHLEHAAMSRVAFEFRRSAYNQALWREFALASGLGATTHARV